MNLSTVRSRLDRLLEAQGPTNGPLAVLCLPANGRGPDAEEALCMTRRSASHHPKPLASFAR
jgi:hypothetical protein